MTALRVLRGLVALDVAWVCLNAPYVATLVRVGATTPMALAGWPAALALVMAAWRAPHGDGRPWAVGSLVGMLVAVSGGTNVPLSTLPFVAGTVIAAALVAAAGRQAAR